MIEGEGALTRVVEGAGVYDYPQYWDIAFRDETRAEAEFVIAAAERWLDRPLGSVYEPGCGGGRLVVELATRGLDVVACDLNEACVRYVRKRLKRRKLAGTVASGDMRSFVTPGEVDVAICPVNTIRHLLSEDDVQQHLSAVAKSVRSGGLYIIGLHLMPPDAAEDDRERWTARHGATTVSVSLSVKDFSRRRRQETLRFSLRVKSAGAKLRDLKLISEFPYRLYTAAQMRSTLAAARDWELISVHDFWYDIEESFELNDELGDTVLVLKRR